MVALHYCEVLLHQTFTYPREIALLASVIYSWRYVYGIASPSRFVDEWNSLSRIVARYAAHQLRLATSWLSRPLLWGGCALQACGMNLSGRRQCWRSMYLNQRKELHNTHRGNASIHASNQTVMQSINHSRHILAIYVSIDIHPKTIQVGFGVKEDGTGCCLPARPTDDGSRSRRWGVEAGEYSLASWRRS